MAISNVAVYMVRYGIGDWAPTYLQAKEIMTAAESKVAFSVHNIVGAVGTIACGWATSKIFKGRCAPMNVICMFLCAIGVLLYWMVGAGILPCSPSTQKVLVYVALCLIGFFIYGPVALTGVQALNLVPRNAAGTAAGFVGLFGYLVGDAICMVVAEVTADVAAVDANLQAGHQLLGCRHACRSRGRLDWRGPLRPAHPQRETPGPAIGHDRHLAPCGPGRRPPQAFRPAGRIHDRTRHR